MNFVWLVGWELAWGLDVLNKGGGHGMKHKFGVLGVIPWVSWEDFMVACSVYIKIRIQVRIASRNSKGVSESQVEQTDPSGESSGRP